MEKRILITSREAIFLLKKQNNMKSIKEIIPLLEEGYTIKQIAKKYKKHPVSIHRWVAKLRSNGLSVKLKRGRPALKI